MYMEINEISKRFPDPKSWQRVVFSEFRATMENEIRPFPCVYGVARFENLADLIFNCLPAQGAIEIQNDAPGKRHDWHHHETDETLIILKGGVEFWSRNRRVDCCSGDVIWIPQGIEHCSIAGEKGAIYIIAFEGIAFDGEQRCD